MKDQVHRRADHRGFARARGRSEDDRSSAQARHFGSHAVQLEGQIWRHGDIGREASAIAGRGDPELKKLLAESMLDQAALKELLTKKW